MRMTIAVALLALAGCAHEAPSERPPRANRNPVPCAGTAYIEVEVVDSMVRRPLTFADASVAGTECRGRTSTASRILLGPVPPGEHRVRTGHFGGQGAASVAVADDDTAFVRIAIEPRYLEISGDVKGADHEPFEPPDTITIDWLRRHVVPGCFHGCSGPFFDRVWSQIAHRSDAREGMIAIATSGTERDLGRRQAVHALGRLRPAPLAELQRLSRGPDSLSVPGAFIAACSAAADSLASRFRPRQGGWRPYHRRIGCGASIADAVPGVRGTYVGEFACPDCDAIRIEVSLDTAGTYRLRREYVGLGEPIVQFGAWMPSDWNNGIYLLGDTDMPWHLVIVDSLTLAFTSDDFRAPDDALRLRRTTTNLAGPSTTACRVGLHRGGVVEVTIEMEWPEDGTPPAPPPGSYVTTSAGCSAPVYRRFVTHHIARLGPLPPGAHEVTLHDAGGRAVTVDTVHAYARWRTGGSIRLPEH